MTILLDFPTEVSILPTSSSFGLIYNSYIHTSPLNGHTKTIEVPGARWQLSMTFSEVPNTSDAYGELVSFLARLRGMAGIFMMYDPGNPYGNYGTFTSENNTRIIEVNSAVNVKIEQNLNNNEPHVGDYIRMARGGDASDQELKIITAVGTTVFEVPNWNTQIWLDPPLQHYNIDPGVYNLEYTTGGEKVKAAFVLTSDESSSWAVTGKGKTTTFQFEAMEVYTR
jgi:hypothetical protein